VQPRKYPILSTFRGFFSKKVIPSDKQLYSMIKGQPEIFLEANANT
jgi:hypothetical protein